MSTPKCIVPFKHHSTPTNPHNKKAKMKATLRALLAAIKPTTLNLEVECKFTPNAQSLRLLRTNQGSPPFTTLHAQGMTRFIDQYFDYNAALERQGIWVRKRNSLWEAKTRHAGDFVHSTFEEVAGEQAVAAVVRRAADVQLHQLRPTVCFETTREAWVADSRFQVVVDVADFGHRVGEVEVLHAGKSVGEGNAEAMRIGLRRFMARYAWAFPGEGGKPVGKLAAYFARFPQK